MLDQSFHRFGPFIIIRTLGRGGMGEVFVARTPWDEHPLGAVKRLRPDVARVPTFAERFKHEAELAVRLSNPNVVGTLDVGSVHGQLYVCSELVLGKDTGFIADRLRERGQGGPVAVGIRLLLDTLAALAYVHGAREEDGRPLSLVHRDVTPGNVLLGYDGAARLADFGLAKSLLTEKSNLTNHGEILGTPHYLAPETIRGEPSTRGSDIYGLGAVMYRFLTGVAPHQGTTPEVLLKVLTERPRPLLDLRPDLPPWLVACVERMMERDPSRRPFDAVLLAHQISRDARSSNLLVNRQHVGRWLGRLFDSEMRDELEERDRIGAFDPRSFPDNGAGTVVLARPRSGSRLNAPVPISDDDAMGTEIELAEERIREAFAAVHSSLNSAPLALPSAGREGELSSAYGADATVASVPPRAPPTRKREEDNTEDRDAEEEGDDGSDAMPTRAVTFFGKTRDGGRGVVAGEVADHDGGRLPGFVDQMAVLAGKNARTEDTPRGMLAPEREIALNPSSPLGPSPTPSSTPKRRPRNVDSVVVSPALEVPRSTAPSAPSSAPPFGSSPPRAMWRENRPSQNPTPIASPSSPQSSPPSSPPHTRSSSVRRRRGVGHRGRDLGKLLGLILVAVAAGIGIGVVVASINKAQPLHVKAETSTGAGDARTRLIEIRQELQLRSSRGQVVPSTAWELLGVAATQLVEGDEGSARKSIREIEQLLALPLPGAVPVRDANTP